MPLFRLKTLFPLVAILSIGFFFWCVDRYDRAALSGLKRPIEHLQNTANSITNKVPQASVPQPPSHGTFGNCEFNTASAPPLPFSEWLTRKNFTRAFIRPTRVGAQTQFRSLEDIDTPVLPPFRALERGLVLSPENEDQTIPCPTVANVKVAADHDVEETSKLLFGLATTVDRLDRLLPSLLYSFAGSKASLLVLVPESDDDLSSQEAYFRSRGLDITLESSPLEFTARYFGLVEAFSYHIKTKRPHTEWVAFIDDDTFFPSLPTVAVQLKQADPSKKHYIGSLSEASWQVDTWGHMAFGGAGVFISKPLLDILMENYDECQSWGEQPGDQKLGQCVERFSNTPLTLWPSLHQMDLTGAPDGIFESGLPIDSLHHWSSWYTKDVVKMAAVSAAAGKRSLLRRWVFDQQEFIDEVTGESYRTFWVLTNGYSIVRYTLLPGTNNDAINFDHTEKTWEEDMNGFTQRFGPMRSRDQEGVVKERYLLKDATIIGNNVHQIYTREEETSHSMIEVVWLGSEINGGAGTGDSRNNH
ncbi:hypothetical protein UA08_01460 [Talaromyces atroroseus]|uniref:Glycosyltransferase family 31 protein n=1 Tax=Talaromyces atroroseus TaxID=1441469 RepID=A0A1Q5QA25_TALAT|nr:hypothetical protein UA08_01460 [Talaromyces atroroseus]OKL62797.1 hypothetical protein UA08_01460 [Talaromyces atroroseus]